MLVGAFLSSSSTDSMICVAASTGVSSTKLSLIESLSSSYSITSDNGDVAGVNKSIFK